MSSKYIKLRAAVSISNAKITGRYREIIIMKTNDSRSTVDLNVESGEITYLNYFSFILVISSLFSSNDDVTSS